MRPPAAALNAVQALQLAEEKLRADEHDLARRLCEGVLRVEAGNARAHYLLGVIAFEEDRPDAAVAALERAIAAAPGKPEYYDYLQSVHGASGDADAASAVAARADKARDFTRRFGALPEGIQNYQRIVESLRASPYIDYPHEVAIETMAVCNAACVFCPYPDIARKGDKMPDDMVAKILRDLRDIPAGLPFIISPFKVNDPLLDVRIFDIMEECNATLPNASLRLFTNGSPLNAKHIARINRISRLEHLWISLNHHDPVQYEQIMKLPMKRTMQNLDLLHRHKAAGGFAPPVLVSRVGDGSADDDAFARFVAERFPLFQVAMVARSEWLGQVEGLLAAGKLHPVGCGRWFELSITATGQVAFCCMDGKAEYPIGNAADTHVLDIYNNPTYRMYRERFGSRTEGAPCNACTNF